jgi:hypothetical protein
VKEAPAQGWNEANGGDEHVGASSDIRRQHSHQTLFFVPIAPAPSVARPARWNGDGRNMRGRVVKVRHWTIGIVCTTYMNEFARNEQVGVDKIDRCPQAAGQEVVSIDDDDEAEEEDGGNKPQSSHIVVLAC